MLPLVLFIGSSHCSLNNRAETASTLPRSNGNLICKILLALSLNETDEVNYALNKTSGALYKANGGDEADEHCVWKIGKAGVSDAVAIFSLESNCR